MSVFIDSAVYLIFLPEISHERWPQSLLTIPFSEITQQNISGTFKYFTQIITDSLLSKVKNTKKWAFFAILMTVNLRGNITIQMTPFSHLLFEFDLLVYLFLHFKTYTIQFHEISSFALYSGLWNTYLPVKYASFKTVNKDILFLRKTFKLLVYSMFCSQFDTNLAPIPWTKP